MGNNLIFNKNKQYIEICEMPEETIAGRAKIKMSALTICKDTAEYNLNGITWLEEYVEDNKQSAIGMPYVVSWFDEEKQIPSDHGNMTFDDDGNVQFDGESVGSVQDVYIENVKIDGEVVTVLMTEGYLFSQRYPKFIKWLKKEIKSDKIHGSIEINGKGKNKKIEYLDGSHDEDGNLKIGRVPTKFDFTGLAILYFTEPADGNSMVFEVNSQKEGENLGKNKKEQVIEINKLSYQDIATLVTRAFNYVMETEKTRGGDYNVYYWIHKFYPTTSEVIFSNYDKPGIYYMTTYSVKDSTVTIGEVVQVEEDWKPVSDVEEVVVNNSKIKKTIGGRNKMEDLIREKDQKIEELNTQLIEANSEKDSLTSKVAELNSKVEELNATVVEVNKSLEDVKAEKETLSTEVNELQEYKTNKESEIKKSEVNSYFENEIPKNSFDEAEVNSLKEYVEKCDIEGLKQAEAALIVKKFKEKVEAPATETNTKANFFYTKEEKLDDVEAGKQLFNN